MSEYESEPIPGLPAYLPEGETLLWQGAPAAWTVARRSLHVGLVAIYFAALLAWRILTGLDGGATPYEIAVDSIPLLLVATASIALLYLLAYLIGRTTIYSITSRRVVMRYGVALPMTVNIPFTAIKAADVATDSNGSGDIALNVEGLGRIGYFHLWPHARAWHVRRPQPALRALPDAAGAANTLSRALHAASGQQARGAISGAAGSQPQGAVLQPSAHATA